MIKKIRCDVPMARSKGLLPCNKHCLSCVACIAMDEDGREEHIGGRRMSDPALVVRNMRLRSYYGDYE